MLASILSVFFVVSTVFISACTGAMADGGKEVVIADNEALGSVTQFGPAVLNRIGLVRDGVETVYICKGELSQQISRLLNLTIRVVGEKNGKSKCLNGKNFEIEKMPSGRQAIVGNLKFEEKEYSVKSKKEELKDFDYKFRDVPEGLKEYKDKKVIIDAVPALGDDGFFKVVSYMEHP